MVEVNQRLQIYEIRWIEDASAGGCKFLFHA